MTLLENKDACAYSRKQVHALHYCLHRSLASRQNVGVENSHLIIFNPDTTIPSYHSTVALILNQWIINDNDFDEGHEYTSSFSEYY